MTWQFAFVFPQNLDRLRRDRVIGFVDYTKPVRYQPLAIYELLGHTLEGKFYIVGGISGNGKLALSMQKAGDALGTNRFFCPCDNSYLLELERTGFTKSYLELGYPPDELFRFIVEAIGRMMQHAHFAASEAATTK